MNVELTRKAMEKVGNPHVLVNLVSRRVRQLNSGGGSGISRPLIDADPGLGVADIALLEIIHDKIGFQVDDDASAHRSSHPSKRGKRRPRTVAS